MVLHAWILRKATSIKADRIPIKTKTKIFQLRWFIAIGPVVDCGQGPGVCSEVAATVCCGLFLLFSRFCIPIKFKTKLFNLDGYLF